jgi:glyoxylase-like metal-dependent hydrolase (beta-lactamase superfamily II)
VGVDFSGSDKAHSEVSDRIVFDMSAGRLRHHSRRRFIAEGLGAGACLLLTPTLGRAAINSFYSSETSGTKVLKTEPWAEVRELAEGVWAVVSTPFDGQHNTFSNGGLIAGKEAVLAIEGFATISGASWLSDLSLHLTGKRPRHVVVTHYHGDHTSGLAGYQRGREDLEVIASSKTRATLIRNEAEHHPRKLLLPDRVPDFATGELKLDLGGRQVTVRELKGHTDSDLSIELQDPQITFGGDLLWRNIFPNFVDSTPSALTRSVQDLLSQPKRLCVPGHGGLGQASDFASYLNLLQDVERRAKAALEKGVELEAAGAAYKIPATLGEWRLLSPRYPTVAFRAWYRELKPQEKQ